MGPISRAEARRGQSDIPQFQDAETKLGEQSAETLTPEKVFGRRWAITLLEQVYQRLAQEHEQQGKAALFGALRGSLAGAGGTAPYAELARQLGMTEGAVKVAVHRLRHRYRELLRETIAETVSGAEEVEDELRYLLRTLAAA